MSYIAEIVNKHKDPDGRVFTILQEIQSEFGYIPKQELKEVSRLTGVPLTQLYGVVTFYAGFDLNPKGKYVINICNGTVCHVKGAQMLFDKVEQELGIKDGETTEDNLFTLQSVRCLGCCSLAPVVAINDEIYGNLNRQKLADLIRYCKEGKNIEGNAAAPQ